MRRAVWVLSAIVVFACSADESAPRDDERRSASRLSLRPESDLHVAGVLGRPAELPAGRRVESRTGDEPGESDLWLVEANGASAPLAPALGPDELPVALPDGRVAFVSGRTTVASLWVVDLGTGVATQLTNHGLRAGHPWKDFVPPPARDVTVGAGTLHYDDGSGRRWSVDLSTGRAETEVAP